MSKWLPAQLAKAFLLAVITADVAAHASEVTRFEIDYKRSSTFLPYALQAISYYRSGGNREGTGDEVQVYQTQYNGSHQIILVDAWNPTYDMDQLSYVDLIEYPGMTTRDSYRIPLTIQEYGCYNAHMSGRKCIIGTGYRNDSAFAFGIKPPDERVEYLFITKGKDRTGNGRWEGKTFLVAVVDYDYDGVQEAFLNVNPSGDREPRVLACVDPEAMRIEWQLPVASPIPPGQLFSCGDSLEPAVLFVTGAPANGTCDENFADSLGYLVRLQSEGRIVFKKAISRFGQQQELLHSPDDGLFFLNHSLPLTAAGECTADKDSGSTISLIADDGIPRREFHCPEPILYIWLADYDKDGTRELYSLSQSGIIRIFTKDLQQIAESDSTDLRAYRGSLDSWPDVGQVLFLGQSEGTAVYSAALRKVADLSEPSSRPIPIAYDTHGNVEVFVVGAPRLFQIEKRSLADLATIAFWEYRLYVFTISSGLLAGLLVTNYYRRRTKRNLSIIRAQKEELEQLHWELKEAQQQLIDQEKYKQAKDIAGGFAHEIRNALFPAEAGLSKLSSLLPSQVPAENLVERCLKSAAAAVEKAIDITEWISHYTKLDSEYLPEPVDLDLVVRRTIDANQLRIDEIGVSIAVRGAKGVWVEANALQLGLVLNNLLLNSLDALTNRRNPSIMIEISRDAEFVRLSFTDNGPGIPNEDQSRVFETFFSTKPNTGHGLGLATAKKIVEMYGGTIAVTSASNQWTRFEIRLKSSHPSS